MLNEKSVKFLAFVYSHKYCNGRGELFKEKVERARFYTAEYFLTYHDNSDTLVDTLEMNSESLGIREDEHFAIMEDCDNLILEMQENFKITDCSHDGRDTCYFHIGEAESYRRQFLEYLFEL